MSCAQCTYGYEKCRLAGQESRRWMLQTFPPQWTCMCDMMNLLVHQVCTRCTAARPENLAPPPCPPKRRIWKSQIAQQPQNVPDHKPTHQPARVTPAGTPAEKAGFMPSAIAGSSNVLGPAPAHITREEANSQQNAERLFQVQTILAKDLSQVIECDWQMDALAKKRADLLTQVLRNQNMLFQMTVAQASTGAPRKASRSPPSKQRKTEHQMTGHQAPQQTMTAQPFPPRPPTIQRQQEHAAQSVSCCRRRQWQPVQVKQTLDQQQAHAAIEQDDPQDKSQWQTVQRVRHSRASRAAQKIGTADEFTMGQLQRQDVQGASVAAGVSGVTPGYLEASVHSGDQTAIHRTMAPGTHTAANPTNFGHALQQEVQHMIAAGCEGEYNAKVARTMEIVQNSRMCSGSGTAIWSEDPVHPRNVTSEAYLVSSAQ